MISSDDTKKNAKSLFSRRTQIRKHTHHTEREKERLVRASSLFVVKTRRDYYYEEYINSECLF